MPPNDKTFIETQFPVSLISKESYKERKAGQAQTLTGLGKWWGRKPLILIRASILGMLMPASSNSQKDRDIFLKILTMDKEGLWQRRSKPIPAKIIADWLPEQEAKLLFEVNDRGGVRWTKGLDQATKDEVTRRYFDYLNYDEKLEYCDRPEQIDGPSETAWQEINMHLGTTAINIQQLIGQLGKARFGHTPRVGDAFCGGGSIPFEAARIGCDAYGSDLNPVATLLTWASIHLIGGGKKVQEKVKAAQQAAFEAADRQITQWGIEHNAQGWRADAYLYCVEAVCPATGYLLPLAPNWVISEKYNVCAVLKPDPINKRYDIEIVVNADQKTLAKAKLGTIQNGRMVCPETGESYAMSSIRGDKKINGESIYGLRLWENDDLVPRPEDTFQERLYYVRWLETYTDTNANGKEIEKIRRHYCAATEDDLAREQQVLTLLKERFSEWQRKGFIPSRKIQRGGDKTEEPIRTRGWCYWHHLFNPRQLLMHGTFAECFLRLNGNDKIMSATLCLSIGSAIDRQARLCGIDNHASKGPGSINPVFTNQALNTQYILRPVKFAEIEEGIIPKFKHKT